MKRDSERTTAQPGNERPALTFPEELSGVFHKNYGRVLVDDSISDKDTILLSMHLLERQKNSAGVSYSECKAVFVSLGRKEPNFKANIHFAKKESLLEEHDSTLYFLSGGLNRIRQLLGQIEKAPVYVIKSGQSFTARKLLEDFLRQEVKSDALLLCDSYISPQTLFPLLVLRGTVKLIQLLTSSVQDPEKFKDYRQRLEKETGMNVEVRISQRIHDRYLITEKKCWSFGTSLKDLGNKDTMIKEVSDVTDSMREIFLERWEEAKTFQ